MLSAEPPLPRSTGSTSEVLRSAALATELSAVHGLSAVARVLSAGAALVAYVASFGTIAGVLGLQLFNAVCPKRLLRWLCLVSFYFSVATGLLFGLGSAAILTSGIGAPRPGEVEPREWALSIASCTMLLGWADAAVWVMKRPRAAV